jgi:8-oxo-dGTP pyrophosphatase MutT (NUDIX family)
MYCNNCGKQGHISRNCKLPITSYGVLLLLNEEIPKIVMVQRKDSLCYIEILRGKYDIYNVKKIKLLLNRISKTELENIRNVDFDILWKQLWLIDDVKETKYMKEYTYSKMLFESMLNDIELRDYIDLLVSEYDTSEWEFPKGKKDRNEIQHECAKRELEEETNIKSTDYEIIKNISPIIENFVGENDINYRNIYYIGICKNTENVKINPDNNNQINEIKDVIFLTEAEAINKIRKYNTTKYKLISYIFKFINNYKKELIII